MKIMCRKKGKAQVTIDTQLIESPLFDAPYDTNRMFNSRMMVSGTHIIATISCTRCFTSLGWKYIKAADDRQRYKEGKYILEKTHLKIVQ
jgi:hypothetical protein